MKRFSIKDQARADYMWENACVEYRTLSCEVSDVKDNGSCDQYEQNMYDSWGIKTESCGIVKIAWVARPGVFLDRRLGQNRKL
jgi:hypothetical protein